ncbi:MAG: SCP2 sterol-binding domain-containing protein [Acidimicrobiales bacterium]
MDIFDDEWLAAAAEVLAALPEVEGASAVIDYVIASSPAGKATIGVTIDNGRVVSLQAGKSDDPDVVISLGYDAALKILGGEMSGDAGFMNGALKVEGAYERWMLALRPTRLAAIEALAPVMADTTT